VRSSLEGVALSPGPDALGLVPPEGVDPAVLADRTESAGRGDSCDVASCPDTRPAGSRDSRSETLKYRTLPASGMLTIRIQSTELAMRRSLSKS
jgi:hypothetical protein